MMWLMEQSMHIITDYVFALITYTDNTLTIASDMGHIWSKYQNGMG